ncbi:DUF3572 domain-containing protein [Roseibacterium sp. SDUM158017]|uniref:DUF3572 domain-containing protein n=1 Tax=Roseicyclus salinarum TaxID=3036773 RepID=UPI002415938D|nr:DUF3572 domain-containing protein [Roseibacterium sp. SDUM158017]MDG4648608.1 DUF3572 domain-containing protein [Roseibacterium sp. SDUM158017]
MKQEVAETGALKVLGWLAGQEDLAPVFLSSTGVTPQDVRDRAGDPDFLASVLDFVLMDDAWVIACAEALDMRPDDLAAVRRMLPGGNLPNWT